VQAHLIAAGKFHDIDFARLELLTLLAEHPEIRTSVATDYRDVHRIAECDLLITYTCDVVADADETGALTQFLQRGGRWIALHGTNSILRFAEDGRVHSPDEAPQFMALLGTRFAAHPPIEPFKVKVARDDHPITAGLRDFSIEDELYLSRRTAEIDVLMYSSFTGTCPEFVESDWDEAEVPILYERRLGKGSVLYCTLGHCRGHYDLQPVARFFPHPQRCSWNYPVFYEILRRAIRWGMGHSA
jgi:type 1 glutamine amidotransferase